MMPERDFSSRQGLQKFIFFRLNSLCPLIFAQKLFAVFFQENGALCRVHKLTHDVDAIHCALAVKNIIHDRFHIVTAMHRHIPGMAGVNGSSPNENGNGIFSVEQHTRDRDHVIGGLHQ